jgi:alpha-dioxygenase
MFMPTIRKWEDLTTYKETLATIRELYGDDVERLDLLVGLLVEKEIPGFAISGGLAISWPCRTACYALRRTVG